MTGLLERTAITELPGQGCQERVPAQDCKDKTTWGEQKKIRKSENDRHARKLEQDS
jgi:hypothetical protein